MVSRFRSTLAAVFAVGLGLSVGAPLAEAQYFGRNRVQYNSFEFKVLKTEHFDIHYYEEEAAAIEYAALMAERWYERLSRLLNHELNGRQKLILYASHPHFRQTNALSGQVDESTQGATEILKRRMVMPFLGPFKETDHVIGHELVHAFQFDITGEGGGTLISGVPGAMRMPLWFIEGMAEYLSVGHIDAETAMWMRATVEQDVPVDKYIEGRQLHPYQHGQALWAYIAGRWGDDVVGRLLKAARTSPSVAAVFQRVLRVSPDQLLRDWYTAMQEASHPLLGQTETPETYGTPVLGRRSGSGYYNIAPALSPRADDVVFLSEKDLFAIEMFLADARTGEVKRKIVKTAVDAHFEGLQFVNSAGEWDRTGTQFAFAGVRKGKPSLTILNMRTGKKIREKVFDDIGEIFNPAWSPSGRYVTFSAITGGASDLYTYDIEQDETRRLTNDFYGDVHPAWSPDGQQLAFVTERFSSGLTSLMHGNYQLALMDPQTGAIQEVQGFDRGKHINPQWSPDGTSLYFISDQNGIANIYRLELETSAIYQVTNLYTGVAGIAPLSPAISVASETGELAFSVFKGGAIEIFLIDDPEVLAGGPVIDAYDGIDPAVLPPADRATNEVIALLNNPFFGLPSERTYASSNYRPGFGLDYIGQPYLVVGASSFGTYIGGGTSLFWSDVLGGNNLATFFQINGGVKDISAGVSYANLSKRLNWGVTGQQTSYLTGGFLTGVGFNDAGQQVFVDQQYRFRQIFRDALVLTAYPLSRVQRLEFQAGYRNISYDYEVKEIQFFPTGQVISDETFDLDSPDPLNLGVGSAALVYDNSIFGIASPLVGQRYRFEVSPMVGGLDMVSALADVRKYFMPVRPFTLAFRAMHLGRYGKDSEDLRLQPLYLGYPGWVRGYDRGSFSINEIVACEIVLAGSCDVYNQLLGSRAIVGNAELRFPLFAVLGLGDGFFGFLPLEMGIFFDTGIAWGSDDFLADALGPTPDIDERAFFLGGDRDFIYSTGVSFKFNMFGYFILGLDYVKPFQRPDKGWHLQFNVTPGF